MSLKGNQKITNYTLPEANIAPEKWMVGKTSLSSWGMAYFQGRTVKLQVGYSLFPDTGGYEAHHCSLIIPY